MENLQSLSKEAKNKLLNELKDFKIYYRDSLNLPRRTSFGCEIEFKLPDYQVLDCPIGIRQDDYVYDLLKSKNYNYPFNVKSEADESIEIITDVLKDDAKSWNVLKSVLDFLKNNNAYCNASCASHVHIGKQLLGTNLVSWLNFFRIWCIFEDDIIKFVNGEYYFERTNFNFYSNRCKNVIINLLSKHINEYDLIPEELCNKKYSINFNTQYIKDLTIRSNNYTKSNKKNTIEFRCPNGTLNAQIWQNNINFFAKLMTSCYNDRLDHELLKYLLENQYQFEHNDDMAFYLADMVFDNDLDKLFFLRQYYKDFNEPDLKTFVKSAPFWR